jgi:hypothetical protein
MEAWEGWMVDSGALEAYEVVAAIAMLALATARATVKSILSDFKQLESKKDYERKMKLQIQRSRKRLGSTRSRVLIFCLLGSSTSERRCAASREPSQLGKLSEEKVHSGKRDRSEETTTTAVRQLCRRIATRARLAERQRFH